MNYSQDLESRFDVSSQVNQLAEEFDKFYGARDARSGVGELQMLRRIKIFLSHKKNNRRDLFKDSKLNSTDCLTLAILANLLAARKGIKTQIARPKNLARYFHAMLVYEQDSRGVLFNLSGRGGYREYQVLTPEQVQKRLSYTKPIIDVANYLTNNR